MAGWTKGVTPGRHPDIKVGADRYPQRIDYSRGIALVAGEGDRSNALTSIPADRQLAFFDRVRSAIDRLRTLPTGARMLAEIDASGRSCVIHRGTDGDPNGNACSITVGNVQAAEGRFVKQFRPLNAVKAKQVVKQGGWIFPRQHYTSELTRILDRARAANPAFTRQFVAGLIGVPVGWMAEYEAGERAMGDNEYYRLCLYLYDHLTPGSGADTQVRIVVTQEKLPDEPLEVLIWHELVHAWRLMTGRRVFENGWEEEAMTTGLPPFSNMLYTENRFRLEAGLPMRDSYKTVCKTSFLQAVRELGVQPAREDRPFTERDIAPRAIGTP